MNVFRGIDCSRFQIDFLLYSKEETDYSREVEEAGSVVYRVPSRKESLLGWHRSLNDFFKNHAQNYAAVHFCGNSLTTIAPIFYANKYKVPIRIIHSHNSSARGIHNRILHVLKRGYARRIATHYMACSTLAAKWFFGDTRAVVIKNGIDTQKFAFDEATRSDIRTQLGIADSTFVLGHVGRFVSEKNHTFLLDIFAEFVKHNPDSILLLIGVGPLMDDIQAKSKQMGIDDNIMIFGERDDVNHLLMAMDCFVMPSLFEGLPFVLIEAQCSGLPCVISDTINKDISLTQNVFYNSLSDSVAEWTKTILSTHSLTRKDMSQIIEDKGYSISNTIQYLQEVYDGQK